MDFVGSFPVKTQTFLPTDTLQFSINRERRSAAFLGHALLSRGLEASDHAGYARLLGSLVTMWKDVLTPNTIPQYWRDIIPLSNDAWARLDMDKWRRMAFSPACLDQIFPGIKLGPNPLLDGIHAHLRYACRGILAMYFPGQVASGPLPTYLPLPLVTAIQTLEPYLLTSVTETTKKKIRQVAARQTQGGEGGEGGTLIPSWDRMPPCVTELLYFEDDGVTVRDGHQGHPKYYDRMLLATIYARSTLSLDDFMVFIGPAFNKTDPNVDTHLQETQNTIVDWKQRNGYKPVSCKTLIKQQVCPYAIGAGSDGTLPDIEELEIRTICTDGMRPLFVRNVKPESLIFSPIVAMEWTQ